MATKKRMVSLLMAVIMIFSCTLFSSATVSDAEHIGTITELISVRLSNVFQDQLNEMVSNSNELRGSSVTLQITQTSKISDFDGNTYTLVECSPYGYMIYHDDSGVFVESSPVVNSPFYGKSGTYKYVGPNEYYIIDETSACRNVISGDSVDTATLSNLTEKSNIVAHTLVENKNEYILNYVNGESDVSLAQLYELEDNMAETKSVSVGDWTCVKNYSFFMNLDDCGYISGGKCGYIAAGILLTYDKIYNGKNTVTSGTHYSYSNGKYSIKTALPTALYNKGVSLGYGASTTSVAIHYTVEDWLADRGITVDHTSLYVPFGNNVTIQNRIKDDRPTIWFGNISDQTFDDTTGNHAVVVYGYSTGLFYSFVAHFGWPGATEVYYTGILGSIYTYEW